MPRALNFGSLNIDYVYSVEHFVRAGETLAPLSRNTFAGGKGLNQSIALARAGGEGLVYHAGCVGRADGEVLLDTLGAAGVNTGYIEKAECPSGQAIIQVNASGENCILYFAGANQAISEKQIERTLSQFDAGDFLILQNEINSTETIAALAAGKGMRIVYNPSPVTDAIYGVLKQKIDYLILNEIEAEAISGKSGVDSQLEELEKQFPRTAVALTCGKRGAYYRENGASFHHGIYEVKVADTTAAGDTFTGFFIAAVIEGCAADEALRRASIASSIAVSRAGASVSIPGRDEVLRSGLVPAN